jgi:hemerythrin
MSLEWNPALAVGHRGIDTQHQELFARLGALIAAMGRGDESEIARLFEFLGTYVVQHFGAEEALMRRIAFPGEAVHRAAHERFIREYQALRKLFDDHGASAAVTIKTKTWIVDWLQQHIASTDQQLAKHLKKTA